MKPERNIEAILEAAVEYQPKEAREAYLTGICNRDAELRHKIDSLIAAHEEAGGFLKTDQEGATTVEMSPEQAEMSGLDIDTCSDIYSLGVVLYELLTGKTPLDAKELMSGGYDEIRRRIREKEPPKPSTRVSTMEHDDQTTIAKQRKADPAKLRGDLDWIVMKTIEKDRSRRYAKANGMALDIRRHLGNEPVLARPPSAAYRFRKYVRRNKAALATATALVVALLLGTTVSVWQAIRATGSAREAMDVKLVADENRTLTEQYLSDAQRNLYASDILLAQQAILGSNRGRAQQLLERHRETAQDLRGWEWDFLWAQCQSEALYQLGTRPDGFLSISFAKDPRLVLTSDLAGQLILWDMDLRDRAATFEADGLCIDAGLSPDGTMAAVAISNREGRAGKVRVWSVESRTQLIEIPCPWWPQAVVFSPDGNKLAILILGVGAVQVWDLRTLQLVRTFEVSEQKFTAVQIGTMEFSPSGDRLAVGESSGRIRIFDLVDGRTLASASGDQTLRLWDTITWNCEHVLEGHRLEVYSIAHSPDGRYLVSGSKDGSLLVWDAAKPKRDIKHAQLIKNIAAFAFSPGAPDLVAKDREGRTVQIHQNSEEIAIEEIGHTRFKPPVSRSVAAASTKPLIAVEDEGEIIRVLDTTKPNQADQVVASLRGKRVLKFIAEDTLLVTLAERAALLFWSSKSWKLERQVPTEEKLFSAAISDDGSYFAKGDLRGMLRFGPVDTPADSFHIQGQKGTLSGCEFSPDGQWIAGCGSGGETIVWDVATGEEVVRFRGHLVATPDLAFSPDGHRLITVSTDSLKIWETTDWQQLIEFKIEGRFYHVRFSPDGRKSAP